MMTALLLIVIAMLLVLIVALALWRKSDSPAHLAKLTAINATLQSNLDHNQHNLERLQDQLAPLDEMRSECAGLKESLAAARDLNRRIEQEKTTWKSRSELLQQQTQELTARRSELQTKLDNVQQQLSERDTLEKRFKDAFRALSADILKTQGDNFQSNADKLFKTGQEEIDKIIRPLRSKIEHLDRDNVANASLFKAQMEKMIEESRLLGKEAQALQNALRKPSVRGRWGEIQLERVLELSGLHKDIDYSVQDSFDNDEGQRLRTDVIVNMPENRRVILDSKVSLAALMEAFNTDDETQKTQALERHVEQIKTHINNLSSKEYWQLLPATDIVVMVLPEFAFLPALEQETDLIEWALDKKVIIVTPPTLLALLKAIALTWKQVRVVEKAREISELGKELHDRLAVFAKHYVSIGKSLQQSVEHYNKANNSWDSRLMPKVLAFKELEVPVTKDLPTTNAIESVPATISKVPETDESSTATISTPPELEEEEAS